MSEGFGAAVRRVVLQAVRVGASAAVRSATRPARRRAPAPDPTRARTDAAGNEPVGNHSGGNHSGGDESVGNDSGDFHGTARIEYRPDPDGRADPGEVVWTWVPFEEDHRRGKDRPVLVIGREDHRLLAIMLTSKDHDRDAAQEARAGRIWMDIGAGRWDPQGRPSEVRLDRVLRLDPARVRREGATLNRGTFETVADRLREVHGWP